MISWFMRMLGLKSNANAAIKMKPVKRLFRRSGNRWIRKIR